MMSEGKFLFSRTPAVGFFAFFIILSTAVLLLRNSSAAGAEGYTYQIDTMRNGMFLQDWLVSGPFPNCDSCRAETFLHDERCAGFFHDYLSAGGGEAGCDPHAGEVVHLPGGGHTRTWRLLHSRSKTINLQEFFEESDQIVVYAFCRLIAAEAEVTALALGSNDGVQVFLNGERVHLAHPLRGRGIMRDEDFVRLPLREGVNRLLLKIENGYGDFGFIARLVDPASPLADLIRTKGQPVKLSAGELTALFIDNYAFGDTHRAGYNGIAELKHTDLDSNLFVPDYAGFNLEHIFSRDSLADLFEPRRNPLSVKLISKSEVLLHQPETPISHVESWTTFKMVAPHYIDITFRCIIHSTGFFQDRLAGLFWASYINAPPDKKIYFRGRRKDDNNWTWIAAFSPAHGVSSTHLGESDTCDLRPTSRFNVVLAKDYSPYVFQKSYYFGRFHHMVFAYLFATDEDQLIRFSQSPNGGGVINPAWDFQFLIPDFEYNREYGFKCRLIYKRFIDEEDIRQEYINWQAKAQGP